LGGEEDESFAHPDGGLRGGPDAGEGVGGIVRAGPPEDLVAVVGVVAEVRLASRTGSNLNI
jgi:hypothetical protein